MAKSMGRQTPRRLMRESAKILKEIFQRELAILGDNMIAQIMARARRLTASQRLGAIKEIAWPGEQAYQQKVIVALAEIAGDALRKARKELPKAKNIKLWGKDETYKFDDDISTALEDLPPDLQKKLTKQAQLLVDTQLSDLEKNIFYQYTDSYDTTEDMNIVEDDLNQGAIEYIDGQAIDAGSNLLAAKVVNEARNAFFFDSDVLEQIDAFVFTNGDPVTEICQDLAGTVFAKDDPNMFRYTPPLHWNCKSYIEPIAAGDLGDQEIEKLKPSSSDLEDDIQFSETYLARKIAARCNHKK